jgi:hypothetical protein
MPKQQKSKVQELYDPFEDDDLNQYQEEVEQRWGNTEAYKQSMKRVQKMTKEEMEKMKESAELLVQNLVCSMDKGIRDNPIFGVYYERHRPGLTVFMRDAIAYFCDIQKSRA